MKEEEMEELTAAMTLRSLLDEVDMIEYLNYQYRAGHWEKIILSPNLGPGSTEQQRKWLYLIICVEILQNSC